MKKRTETAIKAGMMAIAFVATGALMNAKLEAMKPGNMILIDYWPTGFSVTEGSIDWDLLEAEDADLAVAPTTEEVLAVAPTITATEIYQPKFTDDEMLLLKVASCEAGNQGAEGMALVMSVVLNRASAYGCSISDVVYAPDQFACINSSYWINDYIVSDAYEALRMIKDGYTSDAMYFCTPSHNRWHSSHLQYLFTFKDHEFYK